MTSWRDNTKLILLISSCRCARKMILFFFLRYFGLPNSTMLSVLYSHNDVTSLRHFLTSKQAVLISACRRARDDYFFVSIVFRLAMFKIVIFNVLWCHHAMTWRHEVTKLTSISFCRCSKMMIQIYFCRFFGCFVPKYYRSCICMMSFCHNVTSWRHWNDYMTSRNLLSLSEHTDVLESWFHFRFCNFVGY